jgi:hypothetical protein
MILQKQKEANVLFEGETQQSIGMTLDLDSAQILMQMLSKNLYSDSIGSTIRETASNALDSHRRAGVDKPIIVSLENVNGNYEFSVEDFGLGLDADDVENIISKYGKSTKRMSNNELGMFGLGFKAPLAYSSTFYFIARKNGIERKYMMYEGEDVNTIDLLYESETTEENGVKVIVPVKYSDHYSFKNKIKEQLAYFQNVYFNVPDIDNSFKILRNEHYQLSNISTDNYLHICLDDVYYPIDFAKLGIKSISFPIGLRFGLSDGLFPTPNREAIRYTEETKKIILDKIELVATEIIKLYNSQISEMNNLKLIYDYYQGYNKSIELNGSKYSIEGLIIYSKEKVKEPSVEGIENINLRHLFKIINDSLFRDWEVKYTLYNNRISQSKYNETIYLSRLFGKQLYVIDSFPKNLKDYIRESSSNYKQIYFIKKTKSFKLFPNREYSNTFSGTLNTYYNILNLKSVPREDWRTHIKEFQLLKQKLEEYISKDYYNPEIPKEWLDARKKQRVKTNVVSVRANKLEGEVSCKIATNLLRDVYGKNCKFEPFILKLNEVYKNPGLFIYEEYENRHKLDKLFPITSKNNIKLITFSKKEFQIIETLNIHNLMSYDKFMEGNNAPFKRIITANLISQLISKNNNLFNNSYKFSELSTEFQQTLNELQNYRRKNIYQYLSSEVLDAMYSVAKEHNLFDYSIYNKYVKMNELLEKHTFINYLSKQFTYGDNSQLISVFRDLFKYNKIKLNLNQYNSEKITEETLEQLI